MDVETLTMDPQDAEAKLEEYRARRRRAHDAVLEDELTRAETAYRELAKGTPLIMLSQVMSQAPLDHKGRPRLAIARADQQQVKLERWSNDRRYIFDSRSAPRRGTHKELRLEVALVEPSTWLPSAGYQEGFSLVPLVPPAVIGNRSPHTHYVLWEVESWADRRIGAVPDRDPYLLKRIDGDLWAVVGEWDLTDVERAVMRGRISR